MMYKKWLIFLIVSMAALSSTSYASIKSGLTNNGLFVSVVDAKQSEGVSFSAIENGVQIKNGDITKNIIFYGDNIVRVNANKGVIYTDKPSLVVIKKPGSKALKITDTESTISIASSQLKVEIDKRTLSISYKKIDGSEILKEAGASIKEVKQQGFPTFEVSQTFNVSNNESLYGLGQYNSPYMDYRNKEVLMVQTNIGIVVPFLMSTKRYGILWDVYSKSIFKDTTAGATFWAESAPSGVDYYFIASNDMDGVVKGYRELTGNAPMYAKGAYGLFMSKERYKTQDELVDVVNNFRKDQFPLDYIVQDWQYWGGDKDGSWSGMIWDKERFSNPTKLTATLHDNLHVKLMNSIWPSVGNNTDLAKELDAKKLRFEPLHWISKQAKVYDAFSDEGRKIYFKHAKKGLLDVGVDALWMDGTEVEVGGACHNADEVERDIKSLGFNAMGDFTRYLNPYSLLTTKGVYEGQRATSNKRVFTLTRSAWAGQQRYAALPWSGDTTASWQTFRSQISGGINVAMAGLPYWTQDTGGFFVNYSEGAANKEYQELYARWNQFAIFNPIYRIHGTSIDREPYLFKNKAPEIYASLKDAANLRYRMLPYIYSLAWKTTADGYTMMRGLPMDFPDDIKARKIDDQFMFGNALLVHPVTRAMYNFGDPPLPTIPAEALSTADNQSGVVAEYFEETNFEKPAGQVKDIKIDYTWPAPPLANPPAQLTGLDNFTARWKGYITAPETGEFEIGLEGDDGYRLWLDNKLLVEDWNIGPARYKGAKMMLTKGQRIAYKAEYFQGAGNRSLRMSWKTPTVAKQFEKEKHQLNNISSTYLPAGEKWYDFWTNTIYNGDQLLDKTVALNELPLYVRAGSILPLGPQVQYATEKTDKPYEIRIYSGKDAEFTMYEDDNETYAYEQGKYATYKLLWNDKEKVLTVDNRKGSFNGLQVERNFHVVLVSPADSAETGAISTFKDVIYKGKNIKISF